MTDKKKRKLEAWMLGALIVPVGIGIAIYDAATAHTVPLGGECADRDDCAEPADACLSVGSRSVCTMQCAGSCPGGLACVGMDVTLQNAAGFHDLSGMRYCLPADMAAGAPGG